MSVIGTNSALSAVSAGLLLWNVCSLQSNQNRNIFKAQVRFSGAHWKGERNHWCSPWYLGCCVRSLALLKYGSVLLQVVWSLLLVLPSSKTEAKFLLHHHLVVCIADCRLLQGCWQTTGIWNGEPILRVKANAVAISRGLMDGGFDRFLYLLKISPQLQYPGDFSCYFFILLAFLVCRNNCSVAPIHSPCPLGDPSIYPKCKRTWKLFTSLMAF